ncbi:hypothetical protein HDU96_009505 [Phlyctochytrium bullatum]|nr:hypothetical protein HDU96_009505 [Phlyctochytrium bullatum]
MQDRTMRHILPPPGPMFPHPLDHDPRLSASSRGSGAPMTSPHAAPDFHNPPYHYPPAGTPSSHPPPPPEIGRGYNSQEFTYAPHRTSYATASRDIAPQKPGSHHPATDAPPRPSFPPTPDAYPTDKPPTSPRAPTTAPPPGPQPHRSTPRPSYPPTRKDRHYSPYPLPPGPPPATTPQRAWHDPPPVAPAMPGSSYTAPAYPYPVYPGPPPHYPHHHHLADTRGGGYAYPTPEHHDEAEKPYGYDEYAYAYHGYAARAVGYGFRAGPATDELSYGAGAGAIKTVRLFCHPLLFTCHDANPLLPTPPAQIVEKSAMVVESVADMKRQFSLTHLDDQARRALNNVEEAAASIHRAVKELERMRAGGMSGGGGAHLAAQGNAWAAFGGVPGMQRFASAGQLEHVSLGYEGDAATDWKDKRMLRMTAPTRCYSCGATKTPEWRRGPNGPRTLCNACGLTYAKSQRRRSEALLRQDSSSSSQPVGADARVKTVSGSAPSTPAAEEAGKEGEGRHGAGVQEMTEEERVALAKA